jgi:hypothetical protein
VVSTAPVPFSLRWLRWIAGVFAVIGLGMGSMHLLDFGRPVGFTAWDQPVAVLILYFFNGLQTAVVGGLWLWICSMLLALVGHVVGSLIRAISPLFKLLVGAVRRDKRSIAILLPWVTGLGLGSATLVATGGLEATGFWIVVAIRVGIVLAAAICVGSIAGIAGRILIALLSPPLRVLGRRLPVLTKEAEERVDRLLKVAAAVSIWFLIPIDFPQVENARLPPMDPRPAVLLVVCAVAAASYAVRMPISRYRALHLDKPSTRSIGASTSTSQPSEAAISSPGGTIPPLVQPPWWDGQPEPDTEFWSSDSPIGARLWTWDGSVLNGVREPWPEALHRARCSSCREAPGWDHTCGIYAVKDVVGVFYSRGSKVFGVVELSGLVIEHEHGYRAEAARIIEVWADSRDLARVIAVRYPDISVHYPSETTPEVR